MPTIFCKGGDWNGKAVEVESADNKVRLQNKRFIFGESINYYKKTPNFDDGGRHIYVYCGYEVNGDYCPALYPGLKLRVGNKELAIGKSKQFCNDSYIDIPFWQVEYNAGLGNSSEYVSARFLLDMIKLGVFEIVEN